MQIVKVKGWGKADVTSATIVAYLNNRINSDKQKWRGFRYAPTTPLLSAGYAVRFER